MPGGGSEFLGLSGALLALWSSGLTGPKKVTYTGCGDEVAYKTLTSRCSSFRPFVHPSERILQGSASQMLHVAIWYILRAQNGSHITTLGPKYIP